MVTHDASDHAIEVASELIDAWTATDWQVCAVADDAARIAKRNKKITLIKEEQLNGIDLVVVTGGDGTILRAVETVRGLKCPILGINLGHVGFLAEAELSDLVDVVKSVDQKLWQVENRMSLKIQVKLNNKVIYETFALNDLYVEKTIR
jgi:NAD+ kinase